MTLVSYADTENVIKRWLLTTSVAPLLLRSAGVYAIYLALPKGAPNPALVLTLVAGGPDRGHDIPQQSDRIQFDCWGRTRDESGLICRTLINELESLARAAWYTDPDTDTLLACASVLSKRWLPDPDSDTPRYIVDALITTVT